MKTLRILALEPFHGGSHKAFLTGLVGASRHDWQVVTGKPVQWKWRMRTFPMAVAGDLRGGSWDLVFASDYVDLATLVGLVPELGTIPRILYMHENQLTYPEGPDVTDAERERDMHFGVTHVSSALAADAVWFNSAWHESEFVRGLTDLLRRAPDKSLRVVESHLADRRRVMPLGFAPPPLGEGSGGPPHILWNHRWEHDKGPEDLLATAAQLAAAGTEHRWVICGEARARYPAAFDRLRAEHGARIVHMGMLGDEGEYHRWLGRCDFVLSTARHEYFGLAVVEAAAAGCLPLVPRRLSYPEIFPECALFYDTPADIPGLVGARRPPRQAVREHVLSFSWEKRGPAFDAALAAVAGS